MGRHPAHRAEHRPPRPTPPTTPRRWPHDAPDHARTDTVTHRRTEPSAAGATYPLTWLRGLAALAVLIFHAYQNNRTGADGAWPWSGGAHQPMLGTELFVEMFFVLSGFVLWLPVARAALDGPGRPARAGCCCCAGWPGCCRSTTRWCWSSGRCTNPSLPGHWQDLLLHLTFTHVYSDQYIFWTDGPAWSLAVEFHFYVLMALVVPARPRGRTPRQQPAPAGSRSPPRCRSPCVAVGLGYLAWDDPWSPSPHTRTGRCWFSPLSRAADFGLGTGLAVIAAAGVRLGRPARGALGRASAWPRSGVLVRHAARSTLDRRVVAPGVRRWPSRVALAGDRAARRPVAARCSSGGRWPGSAGSATGST